MSNKHALVNLNAGTQYACRVCGAVFDRDDPLVDADCPVMLDVNSRKLGNYNNEQMDVYGKPPARAALDAMHEMKDALPGTMRIDENNFYEVRDGVILGSPGAVLVSVGPHPGVANYEDGLELSKEMTLVEFAEFKGYKLGPWMKQQLQEIDEAGQRGLPNKG